MTFGKVEVYWPQNNDAKDKYETLLGLESDTYGPAPDTIEPNFEEGVALDAQLDILVTPEARIRIKIRGGKLVGGASLMDAQLTGYVMGDISLQAHGDYDTATNDFHYRFGVFLLDNLGYKATAQALSFIDWALSPRQAYTPDKALKLYDKHEPHVIIWKKGESHCYRGPLAPGPDCFPIDSQRLYLGIHRSRY